MERSCPRMEILAQRPATPLGSALRRVTPSPDRELDELCIKRDADAHGGHGCHPRQPLAAGTGFASRSSGGMRRSILLLSFVLWSCAASAQTTPPSGGPSPSTGAPAPPPATTGTPSQQN